MYSLNPLFVSRKACAPFTQEQLNQIKQYLDDGFSKKDVIELTGISREALNQRIKSNNWEAKKRCVGLTQKELDKIHEEYLSGVSIEELSLRYNISTANLADRIANNKWHRPKRKTKYTCDESYFDNIDTEHKAYWLGFLFADGYILSKRSRKGCEESQSFGFSISVRDVELFEKFKQDLQSNHPVNIYESAGSYKTDTKCGRILITSQHMVDALKKWGMIENKTYTIKMPNISENLVPHFIRGFSDGDGSIIISHLKSGQTKYSWQITSTKEMCQSILDFIGKPELKLWQRWPERDVNNWSMTISGNIQVPLILDIIYKDATIYLKRKYEKYAEMRGITV